MSVNKTMSIKAFGGKPIHVEKFNSADEVAAVSERRKITDFNFDDMEKKLNNGADSGVKSMDEARNLLRFGYEPTVEKLKASAKVTVSGDKKRISFFNDFVGYQPVVPLALMGVPNSMVNMAMKPIKAKVITVIYEATVDYSYSAKQLEEAGQKFLGVLLDLESQGYKFNILVSQSYWNKEDADLLLVRIKNSNTPLDLKRMSFPLTHPAFFRAIGFDWYSKTPGGKYRFWYGHSITRDFSEKVINRGFEEILGEKCVVFSATKILQDSTDHIQAVVTGKDSNIKTGDDD